VCLHLGGLKWRRGRGLGKVFHAAAYLLAQMEGTRETIHTRVNLGRY